MRFSRLVLENWRNFGHVDIALQQRAFLVGPNASGKSNFLDVFGFLHDLAMPGGFEQAVMKRGGFAPLLNNIAHISPDLARKLHRTPALSSKVTIYVTLATDNDEDEEENTDEWSYEISFDENEQHQPVLRSEKVWRKGELILDRPGEDDYNDPLQLRQTHLEQAYTNRNFRDIADFFASIRYFHLVPQLVREPERLIKQEKDPFGSDLLDQMAGLDPDVLQIRMKQIVDAIKIAMPQIEDLILDYDKRGVPHLISVQSLSNSPIELNETALSDGTLRMIGLLWSMLDTNGPLLLEEPELSLHPSIVRFIPQMMWHVVRDNPNGQILVSTHSSDLLWDDGIGSNEIAIFEPTSAGTIVRLGGDIEQIKVMLEAGFTAAEAALPYTRPSDIALLSQWGK